MNNNMTDLNESLLQCMDLRTKLTRIERNNRRIYEVILPQIMPILEKLDYKAWSCVVVETDDVIKFFELFCFFAENPADYIPEQIDSIVLCLDKLIHMWRVMIGEEIVDNELSSIAKQEHNAQITSIFKGRLPQRISAKLSNSLYRIMYWLLFKFEVIGLQSILSLSKEEEKNAQENIQAALVRFENIATTPQRIKECVHFENQLKYAKALHEKADIDLQALSIHMSEEYELNLQNWERAKCFIFQILNHIYIPFSIKKEVFELIRHSPYRYIFQREQDVRKSYYPQIFSWDFVQSQTKIVNTFLPTEYNKSDFQPASGMKISLSHKTVVNLYYKLRGKYIDEGTDILDFAYSLTGYPINRGKNFNKVVWIHPRKQTLAFLLGQLQPTGRRGRKYWNAAPMLFRYLSSDEFTPSQLSTQNGQQQRRSEERRCQDWKDLEYLLKECRKEETQNQ